MEYFWKDEATVTQPSDDGVVLSCFPSAGLATTVAGHYIVQTLGLPRTGIIDSSVGPAVAVIQRRQVNPAVRVYGRSDLSIVLSEFPPLNLAAKSLARAILDGAERHKARLLFCLEGVIPHPQGDEGEEPKEDESLWAATSRWNPGLERTFKAARVRPLEEGVLGGVSGALLVSGLERTLPVAALLISSRASEGFPDHRAGAALIEALDRLLPDLKIDTRPLRTQAEIIERALRTAMQNQAKQAARPHEAIAPPIYQ